MTPSSAQPPALPPPRIVRALGLLLVVIGAVLSVSMAFLSYFLQGSVAGSHVHGAQSTWTGTPEFTRTTFELFGAVFLFGLLALAAGIFQIRTGRRNLALFVAMLLLVGVMAYLGKAIVASGPSEEHESPRTY